MDEKKRLVARSGCPPNMVTTFINVPICVPIHVPITSLKQRLNVPNFWSKNENGFLKFVLKLIGIKKKNVLEFLGEYFGRRGVF